MSDPGRHNNRFDILRLLAALLVLWSHCFPLAGRAGEEPLAQWTGFDTLGGLGVAIFFVLSGYLIALSWERQPSLSAFARNRALRIYPALLVLCFLSAWLLGPLMTRLDLATYFTHEMTWRYFANATAWTVAYPLPGVFEQLPVPHAVNGSLWSLPYELRCYLVLAGLAMLWPTRLALRWKALTTLCVLVLMWVLRPPAAGVFERVWGLDYQHLKLGVFFAVGACWATWRRHISLSGWMVLPWVLLAWLAPAGPMRLLAVWLAVATLVLWLALRGSALPRWPQGWGDWSYGCYLYGFPIQQTLVSMELHQRHFGAFVLACTVLTLAAGAASWHLVEKHALRWKRS